VEKHIETQMDKIEHLNISVDAKRRLVESPDGNIIKLEQRDFDALIAFASGLRSSHDIAEFMTTLSHMHDIERGDPVKVFEAIAARRAKGNFFNDVSQGVARQAISGACTSLGSKIVGFIKRGRTPKSG
jgi:hypothetical protein